MLEAVGRQSDVLAANTTLGLVGSLHTSSHTCRIAIGMARTGMNDECLRRGRDSSARQQTRHETARLTRWSTSCPAWPHNCKSGFTMREASGNAERCHTPTLKDDLLEARSPAERCHTPTLPHWRAWTATKPLDDFARHAHAPGQACWQPCTMGKAYGGHNDGSTANATTSHLFAY